MFQRSVRAPNLSEAFEERRLADGAYVRFQPTDDLCSASADPIGSGNADACIATGLPADQLGVFEAQVQFPTVFISGGNPKLKPETAETVTIGVVVSPEFWPNWQFSVDYFVLDVEDEIGDLAAKDACFDSANTENLFCNLIVRDPLTNNVIEVDETNINRVTTTVNYGSGDLNMYLTWQWIANTKNSAPLGVPIFSYPEPLLAAPVTDTRPPQMASATKSNNTDTALYDVFGRSYTLSFSLNY